MIAKLQDRGQQRHQRQLYTLDIYHCYHFEGERSGMRFKVENLNIRASPLSQGSDLKRKMSFPRCMKIKIDETAVV